MSTPRPLWSTGQVAAQRFNRAYPGLQGGRRAGLAPVQPWARAARRRRRPSFGWITPAPITTLTSEISDLGHYSYSDPRSSVDFETVSCPEAWLGSNLDVRATGRASVQGDGIDTAVSAVASVGYYYTWRDGLDTVSAYPSVTPPPGYTVEYEFDGLPAGDPVLLSARLQGRMQQMSNDDTAGTVTLRQVPPANYTLDGLTVVPTWHTPAMFATLPEVASAYLPDDGSYADVDVEFEFDSNGHAVFISGLVGYHDTGPPWPHGFVRFGDFVPPAGGTSPTVEATWQQQRYRFVPVEPTSGWIPYAAGNGWYWDAGLYLSSSFDDLFDQPATLPAGTTGLTFYVVPAGTDLSLGEWATPAAEALIQDDGMGGTVNELYRYPDPSTPDAGSHLWVFWFDAGADTEPPVEPSTLVPASLAENGTG